jgi:hypothetical protein
MRHDTLLFVLVPLFLIVIAALIIKDARPVAIEKQAAVTKEDRADPAPQSDESSGKQGITPECEKELRRTADLLRFFANRIQTGEDTQSVVADMRQQEKKISAVCD